MAEAMGRDVSVTFPGTNDFQSGITLYGHAVKWNIRRPVYPTERFLDVAERVSLGNYSGTATVRCWIDKASTKVPIIPSTTVVTVIISPGITSGGTDTWSVKCLVIGFEYEGSNVGGGPPQSVLFQLVATPGPSENAGTASIEYA